MMTSRCIARTGSWALTAVVLLGGCAASRESAAEPGPEFERPVASVSALEPVQMLLSRGTATDSDANGFADTIPVVVYLFPDARESDLPIWSRGTFRFEVTSEGRRVGRWEFGPELTARAQVRPAPGPGYSFLLRLGPGQDRVPPINADLRASFIHESGRVLDASGSATVRLGAALPVGESS